MTQEYHFFYPEQIGGGKLLSFSYPGKLSRVHIGVTTALVAIGADYVNNILAFSYPFNHRTGYAELSIIRMWGKYYRVNMIISTHATP
jgi:hypothetical protein